jgi:hypothetical protein
MLLVGTVGMLMCGLQPVVLGALLEEHRLTVGQLGWATSAEFLAIGLSISLCGALFRPQYLGARGAIAALCCIGLDLWVFKLTGAPVVFDRAAAGLAEGLMIWITNCMVARAAIPARWAGIFLTLQSSSQLFFSAVLAQTVMQRYGANGWFVALAVSALLALLAMLVIPSAMIDLPKPAKLPGVAGVYSPAAIASLVSVFLVSAFSLGIYAYLAPLASRAHLSTATLEMGVSVNLATSILGSTVAAIVAKRVSHYQAFVFCLVVNVSVVLGLASRPGAPLFLLICGAYGFCAMFFFPFLVPLVIEADSTRRVAIVMPGIQLAGCGAGPILCSLFVNGNDVSPILLVCAIFFCTAFAITTVVHFGGRRALSKGGPQFSA